jgi:NAD(P)-dependent dehydrogenase (short-subunit alcohol dehydrogenase family)
MGIDLAGPISSTLEVAPATPGELAETGRLVEAAGARWLEARLDQRDLPALRAAAEQARAAFGRLDILFANAGVQAFKPILDWQDADWQDTIDVNLTRTCNAIRAIAPHLVKNGGGRIIVTSSTQGRHGTKFGAAYSASKWGIIGLMKSAALEVGVHKITVNAVIPGLIDTPPLDTVSGMRRPSTISIPCIRPLFWKPKRRRNSARSRRSGFRGSSLRPLRPQLCSSRPTKPTW